MAGIFESYSRGAQLAEMRSMNALKRKQLLDEQQRQEKLRNVLAQSVTPAVEAQPAMPALAPEMQEGPVMPGQEMPYPAQPAIEAQPARFDLQTAIPQMAQAGFGPEALKLQQGMLTRAGTTPASLQELQALQGMTPEQQQQFWQIKRGAQTQMIGGVPHTFVPGRGWIPDSTLQQEVSAVSEKEKAKGLGGIASKTVEAGLTSAQKIGTNINNLKEVVRLVGEGAETGPLMNKLPSFRRASVELDNMQKRLGLDVIGSVTFGALSEAELRMALSTALPTNLQGPELVQWANQKIAAQEKLKDYFERQAIFLSKPGNTVAGWVEMQKAQGRQGLSIEDQQALEWANANPSDPRSAAIKQRLGQ